MNQLESEVYLYLLANRPTTAYAVGKALGKATANVYKAVGSLSRAGAVMIEEGDRSLCRAVPQEELVAQMKRAFARKTEAAEGALADLRSEHFDERVYRLEGADEVFERCERMLDSATTVAVIDAFPLALNRIAEAATRAAGRGVDVRIEAYRPIEIAACDVVIASTGERTIEHWGAEQLNVVVDGKEVLLALLDPSLSRVHQAVWSQSLYLACVIHAGRLSEHTLHRVRQAVEGEPQKSASRTALRRHSFFVDGGVPGQLELFERFSVPSDEEIE